jgi:23S rRNA pseudouridine1911/1915/1917 synthase
MRELFEVVHECADLLVINKPAGLVCHPTKGDVYSSLISRARIHLGDASAPQMVNRLDRETSGIILLAKSSESALELRRIWETRAVQKSYLAVVHGHVAQNEGNIDAPLGKDEKSLIAIKDCVRPDGASAETKFAVLTQFVRNGASFSLLKVEPLTGRKHQIRIHLAHIGHPVVGDKLYGGDENIYLSFVQYQLTPAQQAKLLLANQALHAEQVRFFWRGGARSFAASPEPWFLDFAGVEGWPIKAGATDGPVSALDPTASVLR